MDRLADWDLFTKHVRDHIEHYTLPQYGDKKGADQISKASAGHCVNQIERYCARFGKSIRGEEKLDLLKIAHYACIAWHKLLDEQHRRVHEEIREENEGGVESTS